MNYFSKFFKRRRREESRVSEFSQLVVNGHRHSQFQPQEEIIHPRPSYQSSSISLAASASTYQMPFPLSGGKPDLSYFDSMEERLGMEENEFFKKEEFDIEE